MAKGEAPSTKSAPGRPGGATRNGREPSEERRHPERRALLILGMHRSGTSALAGACQALGVDLGPRLRVAQPDNPTGFFEHREISDLHDALLEGLGRTWHDLRPLVLEADRPPLEETLHALTDVLLRDFEGSRCFAVKDPRLCRILPLWRSVLSRLPVEPSALLVVRNPAEVADSLARRDGFSTAKSTMLWLRHMLEAERHTRDWPRALVCYEELLEDWRRVLGSAAEVVGGSWPRPPEEAASRIDAFLAPELRHHRASPEGAALEASVGPWAREVYDALQKAAASGDLSALPEAFDRVRERLEEADRSFAPLLATPATLHNELQRLRGELHEAEDQLADLREQLRLQGEHRAEESAGLREQLAVARTHIEARDTRVRDLEESAGALRQALASREGETASLRENLVLARDHVYLRDERIRELYSELGARQEALARAQGELDTTRESLSRAETKLEESERAHREERAHLQHRLQEEERARAEQERVRAEAERAHAQTAESARALEREVGAMRASRSFRFTRPLRALDRGVGATRSRLWRMSSGVFQRLPGSPAAKFRFKSAVYRRFGWIFRGSESYRTWLAFQRSMRGRSEGSSPHVELRVPDREDSRRRPRSSGHPDAPPVGDPRVSIVVPVHDQPELTLACLDSIGRAAGEIPFEIVVVDDASSEATAAALEARSDIRLLRNRENLGFVRSCNRGAEEARGDLLCFLNSDTEVRPGWLEALVHTFEERPEAGLVGGRLLFPDGSLQEAGGILWADGSAWNYGRGRDAAEPAVGYLREVDYCSGACLAVPTALFRALGGFDEHFAPAYGEDSDLAFRVRAVGRSVLYQPLAEVLHHEGASSGTDESAGAKAHQRPNARKLFERWKNDLRRHAAPGEDPEGEKERDCIGRVLFVDACTPTPDQDAGSLTVLRLMQSFQSLGYKVTFIPVDNFLFLERYTPALQATGIECVYSPYFRSLEDLLRRKDDFDVVFMFRHSVARKHLATIRRMSPHSRVIFHTSDLHYVREQREAEVHGSPREDWRETRERELGVVAQADCTIVHSATERALLERERPGAFVYTFPWILDVHGRRAPFEERRHIVFLGGYGHPPNVDAAQHFARDVFPRIRERIPDVEFHIVGANPPDSLRELRQEGVRVRGYVPDLGEVFDACRLCVAPLRYGAGIKGKVAMAMSYGVPSVASPVAVEGMELEDGRHVVVAEGPEAMAHAVVDLYHDRERWEAISDAGMAFLEDHYSTERGKRRVLQILQRLGVPPCRGRCPACGSEKGFGTTDAEGLRAGLPCLECGATARDRSLVEVLLEAFAATPGDSAVALAERAEGPEWIDCDPDGALGRLLAGARFRRSVLPEGLAEVREASADLVTAPDGLTGVGDPRTFLERVAAALRPGGELLLTGDYDPGCTTEGAGPVGADGRRTFGPSILSLLGECGFDASLERHASARSGIPKRSLLRARRRVPEHSPLSQRLEQEIEVYREVENVHDLPEIFHYWSGKHLAPILESCGLRGVDDFFVDRIAGACARSEGRPVEVVSVGSGNCDFEVSLAERLLAREVHNFRIGCLELNPYMLERGRALADARGLGARFSFEEVDVATWNPRRTIDVVVANQSLHHFEELEALFGRIAEAIAHGGELLTSDIIGRNGHLRWPEALEELHAFWREMPDRYKWNHALHRFEDPYENWDCSTESNEGIRAQDILPLLIERFHFEVFVAWGNLIDVFIDRGFGPNFDAERPEDRAFIDRVAERDEDLIDRGELTPTHMIAALRTQPVAEPVIYRDRTPPRCVRRPAEAPS